MTVEISGFDYDNFNPEGVSYPPSGEYLLAVVGAEDKPSKDGHRMINIYFEIAGGELRKTQFRIGYYVGNPNQEQAKWAYEALGRLYYGVTGEKPTSRGFNLKYLEFKPFQATFDASPNKNGDIFPKLKNFKPQNQQAPQTSQAPTQYQQPIGGGHQAQYAPTAHTQPAHQAAPWNR